MQLRLNKWVALFLALFVIVGLPYYIGSFSQYNQNIAACERSNVARHQQITLYEAIIGGNSSRASNWRFYKKNIAIPGQKVTGAPVVEFANKQVKSNEGEKASLKKAEQGFLDSQSAVSTAPNSNNPYKAIHVDCTKAYSKPFPLNLF